MNFDHAISSDGLTDMEDCGDADAVDFDGQCNALPSFEDAYRTILKLAGSMPTLPECNRPLAVATDRILAKTVTASTPIPFGDLAECDGYAVQSRDLGGDSDATFKVCGEFGAGESLKLDIVQRRTAVRVGAGTRLQSPFDTVVPFSDTVRKAGQIHLRSEVGSLAHVRQHASVFAKGETVLMPGSLLGARDVAAIAAAGQAEISVLRKLRVAIMSVAEHTAPPESRNATVRNNDVSRPMIQALLSHNWIEVRDFGAVANEPDTLRLTLDMASGWADVILTTGGVSVETDGGVATALSKLDATTFLAGASMQPGNDVRVARIGGCILVAMPSGPIPVQVIMTALVQPMLAYRAGLRSQQTTFTRGIASNDANGTPGHTDFLLVQAVQEETCGPVSLHFLDAKSCADVGALMSASGIARLAASTGVIKPGDELIWFPFEGGPIR